MYRQNVHHKMIGVYGGKCKLNNNAKAKTVYSTGYALNSNLFTKYI